MNHPNINPAQLQKEIQDFLTQKYGDRVVFPQAESIDGQKGEETSEKRGVERIDFDLTPEELVAYLDRYVVRQDDAKEILATKICTHFHRVRLATGQDDLHVGHIKNNIILIGPTGVGKTYLVRLIAGRIGVPFVKGDATKFSETGYVGGDVEDLVRELVREADGDIELAQHGIIYIDEIDKIASSGSPIGPDVSRTGVQRNLLKLMEETEVDLRPPHDLASQMESLMQFQKTGQIERRKINTKHILFIVSGAFNGLEDMIKRRLRGQAIGFTADRLDAGREDGYLSSVTPQDLIEYGFESEFVGRLPIVAVLSPLTADDLYTILNNHDSPVIFGKRRDFQAYGIEIEFEDAALRKIAGMAYREKIGARGLVSVMERILMKFEKRLPSTRIKRLVVTESMVDDPVGTLERLLVDYSLQIYRGEFYREYQVSLSFSEGAITALICRGQREGKQIDEVCREMLKDYGHGLKLIGCETFTITEEVLGAPKEYLDVLVRRFYQRQREGKS
jgi:endopeptidase Clp ATP-binding regulatory subunit ClpX